jgi:hypothetical protein
MVRRRRKEKRRLALTLVLLFVLDLGVAYVITDPPELSLRDERFPAYRSNERSFGHDF